MTKKDNIHKESPNHVEAMSTAATDLLESMSREMRMKASYPYMDGERLFWYYPPLNRHGVPLRDMNLDQRRYAMNLIASGLDKEAYDKVKKIIGLETVLASLEASEGLNSFIRDPELYYLTIFGDPTGIEPWGWRAEGHHISLNFSLWNGDVIAVTPLFFGSNPARVPNGPNKGMRVLSRREDLALQLGSTLDSYQKSKAVIYEEAPYDIVTYNSTRASLPLEEGIPWSRLKRNQQDVLVQLVNEYVRQVRSEVYDDFIARVTEQGFERLHFAWGGKIDGTLPHYYRIHGGDFLVEFDNYQNGANHIHSVWRQVSNDFAADVLREHLYAYHVL